MQGDPRIDRLLRVARDLGIPVAGVLSAPPRSLAASENAPKRTLLEVLSSTPDEWRPHLALLLARHGEQIASWQIGDDEGAADQIETRLLAGAVRNVRSELLPLIGSPTLAAPAALNMQADVRAQPVDILSITVPWSVPAHRLAELLRRTDIAAFPQRWVTLEAPPRDRYTRRARLIEYARRLVVARGSGAEYVFVPQPWNVGPDGDGLTPDEEFILLRTIARTLGPLTPAGTLWLGHGVQAHLFADDANGRTFIAAWTDADEIRPRVVPIDLGSELKQIDLWGNDRALAPENGESTATLDALPVIIGPIRAWRARMLSSFTVENPTLEVAVGESERKLELTNPMPRALRGILRLEAPAGWVVRPAKIDVDLEPGASLAQAINVRIPSNQAVGDYTLTGRLTFDLPEEGHLTVRAPLYVRCPGLDVGVLTDTEGSGLRVIQRITNLTGETISLRTFLVARGEPIDAQTIAHLAAGQTAVREYRIEDARSLAGGFLRVSAQQIGGRMQSHQVISLPSR